MGSLYRSAYFFDCLSLTVGGPKPNCSDKSKMIIFVSATVFDKATDKRPSLQRK